MHNKLLFILFLFSFAILAQENDSIRNHIIYENINSEKTNSVRDIKISLPKNYYDDEDKYYPVFFVFDGHYMFDLVSGNIGYMSFWGDIPESIVVGIDQSESRYTDVNILDNINFTPISDTANFFDFITLELIPYINKNYRTTNFKVAVGNESTANFINFFLIRKTPIMSGYIAVSPKYSDKMKERIATYLINSSDDIFYYVSTSNQDFKSISEDVIDFNIKLDSLNNENVYYKFQNLEYPTHYSLPLYSIPYSIDNMFSLYRDITRVEYDSVIMNLTTSPVKYLEEKYKKIEEIFGVSKKISVGDFIFIEQYIDETEKFNFFKDLSKLAIIYYRETILPSYYMGRYYEQTGKPIKAMQLYRSAYNMDDFVEITKEYLFQRANDIAVDFGYDRQEY